MRFMQLMLFAGNNLISWSVYMTYKISSFHFQSCCILMLY